MEDKMIVIVFDNEKKAYEGVKAINELHAEGTITLYASAVIAKSAGGKVSVKQIDDEGPIGTGVGLATGTLIGLLGGPVGVAVGAGVGTLGGMMYDFENVGVGADFLEEVEQNLKPGKVALVTEAGEEWVMPLDTRMEALGGVVIRRMRDEVLDTQIERDAAAITAEIAELQAERARAKGEAKAKLQAKIDSARKKLQATRNRAKAAAEAKEQEMKAKVKSLMEQAARSKGEAKAKFEARVAEIRSDHERRAKKLHQAWELTKEALA